MTEERFHDVECSILNEGHIKRLTEIFNTRETSKHNLLSPGLKATIIRESDRIKRICCREYDDKTDRCGLTYRKCIYDNLY